jgi:hypothetical protein
MYQNQHRQRHLHCHLDTHCFPHCIGIYDNDGINLGVSKRVSDTVRHTVLHKYAHTEPYCFCKRISCQHCDRDAELDKLCNAKHHFDPNLFFDCYLINVSNADAVSI